MRRSQRAMQREQTRAALVESARSLIRSGGEVTMPGIARAADVSEATAYRYFPDLLAIMQEGFVGIWPSVEEVQLGIGRCSDPVERVAMAADFLARNVLQIQGAVRAMIALTIARPDAVGIRPGYRLGLIEAALAPLGDEEGERLHQLRNDLAVVISAEALFTLLDLKRLPPDAAIASVTETARNLVRAALHHA